MKEDFRFKWLPLNDRKFALISTLVVTFMLFGVFLGQWVYSDVVTFGMTGDSYLLTYPSFLQTVNTISNGSINGVDLETFNGATEFFMRPNLPTRYPPLLLFAFLGQSAPRLFFGAFFAVHFGVSIYFCQRLAVRFFAVGRWLAFLFACSCTPVFIYELWYSSFFIISTLVVPLIYSILCSINCTEKKYWIFFPIPYILAFTAGYITCSVAMVAFAVCYGFIYAVFYLNKSIFEASKRVFLPFFAGCMLSVVYCLQIFLYIKTVVRPVATNMHTALDFSFSLSNLVNFMLVGTNDLEIIEQQEMLYLGIPWVVFLILLLCSRSLSNISKPRRILFWSGVFPSLSLMLISIPKVLPLGAWFYSAIPILGQMHLPIRYLMFTLPFLFLSFVLVLQEIDTEKLKPKVVGFAAAICAGIALLISIIQRVYTIPTIQANLVICELLLTAVFFYLASSHGWKARSSVVIWCGLMVFCSFDTLSRHQTITNDVHTYNNSMVVMNQNVIAQMDSYIQQNNQEKNRLRFMIYTVENGKIPHTIMSNFPWFHLTSDSLTNYYGYEPHLGNPREYLNRMPYYSNFDISYLKNTRADFAIVDLPSLEENAELQQMINSDVEPLYLLNGLYLYKLNHYVPSRYTAGQDIIDQTEPLDNGYFYSHSLGQAALVEFQTDDSTYFRVQIKADNDAELVFLPYPNRCYQYYIDEQRVEPFIDNMQAFLQITEGLRTIEIRYVNTMDTVSITIQYGYIFVAAIFGAFLLIRGLKQNNTRINKYKKGR